MHRPMSAQARIHQRHAADRHAMITRLYAAATVPATRLADKLAACGRYPTLWIDSTSGRVITSHGRCNQRMCPTCAEHRGREVRDRVMIAIAQIDWPALVTLTIRSTDDTLSEAIDHLMESYRRLRRCDGWAAHVRGGVAVLEVTQHTGTRRWHPHLHIVADMDYWPQSALSVAWSAASGGSTIVDVRRVASRRSVAAYVAKYVAKIAGPVARTPAEEADRAAGLHGRRIVQTFGRLHGIALHHPPIQRDTPLTMAAYIQPIEDRAHDGDEESCDLLRRLHDLPRWPSCGQPTPDVQQAHLDCVAAIQSWRTTEHGRMYAVLHPPRPLRQPARRPHGDDGPMPTLWACGLGGASSRPAAASAPPAAPAAASLRSPPPGRPARWSGGASSPSVSGDLALGAAAPDPRPIPEIAPTGRRGYAPTPPAPAQKERRG